jgi:hypothetical protein
MPYAVSRVVWEVEVPAGYDVVNSSSGLTPVPPLAMSDGMQRLFGPLLRRDGTLFRFWDTSAWHSWWKGVPPEDDFRGRLADSLRDFAGSVRPRDRTWSRLCTHLNQFAGNRLVVDTVALERATISLQDEAVLTETALPEELFGLASSGAMNLVRTHRGLLLTTRAESAELTEHSEKGLRWLREDSGLPAAIDQATVMGADSSGRFVRSSMLEQTSGKGEFANQCEPFVFAHDAATLRFEAADYPQDLSLMLIERPLVIGWAAFVGACLTIAAGVPRARPAHRAFVTAGLVVAVGFAMTLIVPEPLIAPCVTLAWGTLAVLAWWSHLPAAEPVRGATERRVPVVAVRAGTVSLIALLLVQAHAVHGQSEPDRKEQNYINVFIPYDPSHPESRQSGGRVMMPRPTYDRLLKLAESDLSGLVLIRSTAISGLLAGTRMELNIDVELESFTALQPTRVLIPLRGMVVRSAFLDDQACPVEQAPGGLYVECSGSGRHQLHLSCVLSLAPDDTSGSLDLSIPPGGRTALELILPADLELKLESAVTQERYLEGSKQRFRADLAGDGSLVAHWSRAPAMPVRLQSDIAMLLTWHGAIAHLEMRALIRVQGLTRQLIIETDPRLSLKGVNAPGLTGYSQLAGPEKVEWYLDFDRPLDRTVPIAFDCLLQSAGGDELRIPEIDVRGARAGSKLLPVSGSEESKYQLVESITGQLGSVDEFRTVWKEELPRAVRSIIRLPSEARGATVRRVREQTRPVLELQTDLRVTRGRTMMQARFAADVLSKGVWHQLELPARFNLSNVRTSPGTYWRLLKGSGESTPDTVPALGNGVVDPLDGAQQSILWLGVPSGDTTPTVEIDGWLPHPEGAEPIPLVRSDRACSFSGTLNIWRARDLTIELNNVRGMTAEPTGVELKPPSAEFAAESQFRFEGFDYSGDWKMESRPARVATTVATRVLVDDKAAEWICVVEYQVMDGALDTVMLGLPAAFPGSIQISGEGISHREVSDHGGNQVWKITLSQPRWQPFRLMLRAPIGVESDGHIAVPIAVPQGEIVDLKQFLLVLNATDHKLRIDGLGPHESVPSETFRKWFSEPITKSVSGSYELKGASGFADVGPLAATSSAADHVVGLERHRAWIGARGPVWLHSTLFVRARSSGAFMLRLPHGSSIYRLLINGQTVRPNTEPNGQLSVFLSETDRPYQITALSRRDNDTELSSKTTVQFSRLTKSDCPSLWTISLPSRYPLLSATSSDTCLSALQVAEAAALANELEYLLELPRTSDDADRSTIVAELQDSFLSAVEQAQQTAAWEREIQQSSRRLEVDRERAVRELRGLVQSNQRMWQRLGAMGIRLSDEPQPFRPRGHAPFLVSDGDTDTDRLVAIHTAGPFGTPRFYVTHGADLSIELDRNPQSLSLGVLIPAFLIGLAGWCTSLLFALPGGQLRRWFAVFAFGGLFWSWNLRPAPIGPLLLIIAIMMFTLIVARRMQRARV